MPATAINEPDPNRHLSHLELSENRARTQRAGAAAAQGFSQSVALDQPRASASPLASIAVTARLNRVIVVGQGQGSSLQSVPGPKNVAVANRVSGAPAFWPLPFW